MTSSADLLQEIFDVRGARAVVTGAASGIGQAIAEVLARTGARVTLVDRDEAALDLVAKELHSEGCEVSAAVLDITDATRVEAVFDEIARAQGGIDVVFANAGGGQRAVRVEPTDRTLDRYPTEAWTAGIELNLTGAFLTVRAAARQMRPARKGSIVVTASTAGLRPDPYVTYDYAAAKAALVNLVRQAALDLAPDNIRVNAIAPGPFRTNIGGAAGRSPASVTRWSATVPLGRMGETHELRGLALLLASPASAFISGTAFPIDGGALALSEPN